jgi:hypothetical protein
MMHAKSMKTRIGPAGMINPPMRDAMTRGAKVEIVGKRLNSKSEGNKTKPIRWARAKPRPSRAKAAGSSGTRYP